MVRFQRREVLWARFVRFWWLLLYMWRGYCALDGYSKDGRATLVAATVRTFFGKRPVENAPPDRVFWSRIW